MRTHIKLCGAAALLSASAAWAIPGVPTAAIAALTDSGDAAVPTAGYAEGSFTDPTPPCAIAVCSGEGTNEIDWGTGLGTLPSSASFTGDSFAPLLDIEFKIGDFTYFNGTILTTTGVDSFDFNIDVYLGYDGDYAAPLRIATAVQTVSTPNVNADPRDNADTLVFNSGSFSASFNVLESETASVPLYAKLTQTAQTIALVDNTFSGLEVEITRFGEATDGGFVTGEVVPEISGAGVPIAAMLLGALSLIRRERRTRLCNP